jgi:hypothetical protein
VNGPAAFSREAFSGKVPLFPLPDVVLFPGTLLPLHIFEPRYRQMTRDALEGERLIAMALLKPGWEADYHGNPPVHEVVGIGRIVEEKALPDGRFLLLLEGVARARLLDIVRDRPYRVARVLLLEDRIPEGADRAFRPALEDLYARRVAAAGAVRPWTLPLGTLCDRVAAALVRDPAARQELLAEEDVGVRCRRLLAAIPPGAGVRGDPGRSSPN